MSSMTFSLGIVGAGQFSGQFATLFQAHPGVSDVYVTDLLPERAEQLAAAQGLAGTRSLGPGTPIAVVQGPARVQLYATPGNTASASVRAEFGYHYA